MKKVEDSIFNEIYKRVIEANEPQIKDFKALTPDKDNKFVFDLGIRVIAYDSAFKMLARSDHKKKELEGKSVLDFVSSEGLLDESTIQKTLSDVDRYYQSSFRSHQRHYHEQVKQILIDAELERVKPPLPSFQDYLDQPEDAPDPDVTLSLFELFNEKFLPRYKKRRKAFAIKLLCDFNVKRERVNDIQIKTFNIIVDLANQRISRESKTVRAKCIQYLEDYIEYYFPILLKDLELDRHVRKLVEIRKKSNRNSFNTVCNRCGKPLLKRGGLRFCTKIENRICYEARRKENKKSPWPKKILMTKNLCQNCGKYSSLDHVHKRKGLIKEQFCGKTCYEAFRKRPQRRLRKKY